MEDKTLRCCSFLLKLISHRIGSKYISGVLLKISKPRFKSRYVHRVLKLRGTPQRYNNNTIEVSQLRGYAVIGSVLPAAQHYNRSYCMGMWSISAALTKWPTLRRFKNWAYTTYLGSAYIWTGPLAIAANRTALLGVSINTLTITIHDLHSNEPKSTCFSQKESEAVMPFYVLQPETIKFQGDISTEIADRLRRYVHQKLHVNMQHTRGLVQDCLEELRPRFPCDPPHYNPEYHPLRDQLLHAQSGIMRAHSIGDFDMHYSGLRSIIEPLKVFLEYAVATLRTRPIACPNARAQEFRMLDEVRSNIGWIRFWSDRVGESIQ